MTLSQKLCIIIYTFLILQCTITTTAIYIKAKKNGELYSLIICNSTMVLWLFFSMVEKMSSNIKQLFFSVRFSLLPIIFIGALWLIFSLYYAGIIKPQNKVRIISLILVPPLLCAWPILTDKFFHLILISKTIGENKDVWGSLFYISTAITYLYAITSMIIIIRKSRVSFGKNAKIIWLVIAIAIPIMINFLTGMKIVGFIGFDMTPLSFSLFSIIISIYIFRYRFIEIIPVAAYELFSTINEAVIIVDRKGSIIEFNRAAAEYFGSFIDLNKCVDIQGFFKLLNSHIDDKKIITKLVEQVQNENCTCYEDTLMINLPQNIIKQYSFCTMLLTASKAKVIGKLITFRDVTEYRVLTLENERNRLSDDLHDSLGNCINVISSNLEYALKNFKDSQEIKECLSISYAKATGALLNLRRIVDELRPVDIENNGLIWALESLFYKLRIRDINIEFIHNNLDDQQLSSRKHGEAIYFICQEAINNSVIHGRAKNITITINYSGNQLKLYITDDGSGCDQIVRNRGLNSITNRIKALGGEFNYGSPDDGGFNIRAIFPI